MEENRISKPAPTAGPSVGIAPLSSRRQKADTSIQFSSALLELDCAREAEIIQAWIREQVCRRFKKKGAVIGLSGGLDSSVVAALAVRALGEDRVLGLLMPERDSSPNTLPLSQAIARHLNIKVVHEDITGALQALGCYERRDEAIKLVIPEYGPDWKSKMVLPNILDDGQYRVFCVVAQSPDGPVIEKRVTLDSYLGIVAATNFKQRTRKMLEYYHADRMNFAVVGTPNYLEYNLGFFVKLGDGAADLKPIAHLYKTQVYHMADFLQLPLAIRTQQPTTDTYSLFQTQEEFYFSLPYHNMDLILYGKENGFSAAEISTQVKLSPTQVERVFQDIEAKNRVGNYLHAGPAVLFGPERLPNNA